MPNWLTNLRVHETVQNCDWESLWTQKQIKEQEQKSELVLQTIESGKEYTESSRYVRDQERAE